MTLSRRAEQKGELSEQVQPGYARTQCNEASMLAAPAPIAQLGTILVVLIVLYTLAVGARLL